ncbi:hypothetical protein COOONC_01095 [Cooperia oncophora]
MENHHQALGPKMTKQIPHQLTEGMRMARLTVVQSILFQPHRKRFFEDMIAGESWSFYDANSAVWVPRVSRFGCTYMTMENHHQALGPKMTKQIPHQLTEGMRMARLTVVQSILFQPHRKRFFEDMIAGESWSFYDANSHRAVWVPRDVPTMTLKENRGSKDKYPYNDDRQRWVNPMTSRVAVNMFALQQRAAIIDCFVTYMDYNSRLTYFRDDDIKPKPKGGAANQTKKRDAH